MAALPESATDRAYLAAILDELDRRTRFPRLLEFTRRMFEARNRQAFKPAAHQERICDALEAVTRGEFKRLIINVPPRSGKTELAVINFIAWCMGRWPDSEFIHASYSAELATTNAAKVRDVMQHEGFAGIFGAPAQFDKSSNAKDHFRTAQGGQVYATGAGGTITGYGAGKMRHGFGGAIVIDDPHKAAESQSKIMRRNVIDWFTGTMESRRNSPHTPIIVIMQRLHTDDLSGFLLAGGNGEAWQHVCIPAMGEDGASFWPEQFPVGDLRRIEQAGSYTFASQYQQRPKVLGGNIVKSEWFKTYGELPPLQWRAIYADTAQKTKERHDFSVFECWGLGRDGRLYLVDLIRGKWEAPELERRAVAFWQKHVHLTSEEVGSLRAIKVEDKSSGTGLIQSIRAAASAPVIGIPRTKDKLTRLLDVVGKIEAGFVSVPRQAPWLSDFLDECESMTADGTHPHDDQVDPMIDAINDMIARPRRVTIGVQG